MFPKLKRITLTSGESIDVAEGVTVVVGPNNAGKSLILRETHRWLTYGPGSVVLPPLIALKDLTLADLPPVEEFLRWLNIRHPRRPAGIYRQGGNLPWPHYALPNNQNVPENQVSQLFNNAGRFGPFGNIYALHVGPGSARDNANPSALYDVLNEQPQTPVQKLYSDTNLEEQLSLLTKRAFNVPLTVNRLGGSQITVHVGAMSIPPMPPPATPEYLREITALPQIQDQGDGVKAFVGLLLAIRTADYPLLLIDEPETFLHPPQAYLFGQILAEQHDRKGQVVIATHSIDIMQGLTSTKAASGAVSVVRLTRQDTINHVAQLATVMIHELHDDPLMRYSHILDGLFFHGTVLCEGDSDCTYYQAVLDSIDSLPDGVPTSSVSLNFTHCGGKARLAKAVRALRAARVPVACIVDIDFLQNEHEFGDVIIACDGNPDEYMPLRNNVASAVGTKDEKLTRETIKEGLNKLLDEKKGAVLSPSEVTRLSAIIRPALLETLNAEIADLKNTVHEIDKKIDVLLKHVRRESRTS